VRGDAGKEKHDGLRRGGPSASLVQFRKGLKDTIEKKRRGGGLYRLGGGERRFAESTKRNRVHLKKGKERAGKRRKEKG